MVEAVGMTGTSGGSGVRTLTTSASASSASSSGGSSAVQSVRMSPVMISDPVAGVIVAQYLASNGSEAMQIPSAAALAYLRSGLTADGLPKREAQVSLAT